MKNTGIIATELDNVSYDTILSQIKEREKKNDIPKVLVELRYDNYQKKRYAKRQLIVNVS